MRIEMSHKLAVPSTYQEAIAMRASMTCKPAEGKLEVDVPL